MGLLVSFDVKPSLLQRLTLQLLLHSKISTATPTWKFLILTKGKAILNSEKVTSCLWLNSDPLHCDAGTKSGAPPFGIWPLASNKAEEGRASPNTDDSFNHRLDKTLKIRKNRKYPSWGWPLSVSSMPIFSVERQILFFSFLEIFYLSVVKNDPLLEYEGSPISIL